MIKNTFFIFLLIISSTAYSSSKFNNTKKIMYDKLFENIGKTFYCNCNWKNKNIDLSSCGLKGYFPKKHDKRAKRTEAEHIIPASWALKVNNKYRKCTVNSKKYKVSKRKYCAMFDKKYKKAINDLTNLWPVVGIINSNRSNKPFVDHVANRGFAPISTKSSRFP